MNRTQIFISMLCAVIALSASSVSAQSLAQKKELRRWEADIQSGKEQAEEVCGKSLAVEMLADSVWNASIPEDQQSYSLGAYCANGCLFGVELVCKDELGKQAVAEKIEKIVCKYQADDTPKISIDSESKTMNCAFSYRNMQFQSETRAQLEAQL